MRIGILLMALIFPVPTLAADTPTARPAFRVVQVVDQRLPRVSDEILKEALRIASNWIEVWYHKRVRFELVRTEPIDSYMNAHLQKLPVPGKWKGFPYALDGSDSAARFLGQQVSGLRQQSLESLKSYVPESIKPLITSPEAAAQNLLRAYEEKLSVWKNIRTKMGVAFFDTSFPIKHSYWHWERVFESVRPDSVADHLIITNVMLLDDALSDAPPHSLLRGGLLNGMAEEESPQAIISTFPILTDVPSLADLRDTAEFSPKDRVLALAHIIAHEFGAHVIQGYRDVYDHDACLAVPTAGLAYVSTLRRLHSGPPCVREHPRIDRRINLIIRHENMAHRFLEIKDYAAAKSSVERALALDPKRPLLKLMLRQLNSKLK